MVEFRFKPLENDHSDIRRISELMLLAATADVGGGKEKESNMSSIYICRLDLNRWSGKSAMKTLKRSGPRTDPWRTPEGSVRGEDIMK